MIIIYCYTNITTMLQLCYKRGSASGKKEGALRRPLFYRGSYIFGFDLKRSSMVAPILASPWNTVPLSFLWNLSSPFL